MSFPRYPSYKDSRVEWLGNVPENWEVVRLGRIFKQVAENGSEDLPILSVSIHDGVSDRELDDDEMDRKVNRSDDRTKYKKVQPGDLVYNMMRAWQGGFGTVLTNGMVSPAYVVARPCNAVSTRFVENLLRTPQAVEQMRRLSRGVTDFRLRLYWDEFKSIQVVLPPASDEAAIAEFLDREKSKIDELVQEQQLLIELLKEKCQGVISHAVTKGLNPDAPMKPSGCWIGDVPQQWDVTRLKYACYLESGHTPRKSTDEFWVGDDCCIPWVSLNDTKTLSANDFIDDTVVKISELGMNNSSAHLIQEGAVVMTRDGARVGLTAITTKPMCVSQHIIAWVCGPRVFNQFLLHVLYAMNDEIFRITAGATIPTIGMPDVKRMTMPIPPITEQHEIVEYLLKERQQFSDLIKLALDSIDLLQERRIALISAAVTGKLDVRGLA